MDADAGFPGCGARRDFADERLRPGQADNPDSFKVRWGKAGGYRDYLDPVSIAFLDAEVAKLDPFFGYQESTVEID